MSVDIREYIDYESNPKQQKAFDLLGYGYKIFYGGQRGGGKSFLCESAAVLLCNQILNLRVIIIRKTLDQLRSNFIQPMERHFPPSIFNYKFIESKKTSYFGRTNSIIYYRPCETSKDAENIQGSQYHLMIIDEATNFYENVIERLMGSLRREINDEFIPTLLMTGNPGGPSHMYFKTRFVKPEYHKWQKEELAYKDKYKFIPANVYENPFQGEDYIDRLKSIKDPLLRKRWLEGDWDIVEGQFFSDFNRDVHVVESFKIPDDWYVRQMGIDLGHSEDHPCVALWVAQNPNTNQLHVYREYTGIGYTQDYIKDILRIEEDNGDKVSMRWCDPSMFNRVNKDKLSDESPAFMFTREGLPLQAADNKRINGWRVLKEYLRFTENDPPKLVIHNCCQRLIETLPMMAYKMVNDTATEDMDTRMRYDDYSDALRYVLISGFFMNLGYNALEQGEEMEGKINKVDEFDERELYISHFKRKMEGNIPKELIYPPVFDNIFDLNPRGMKTRAIF